MSWAFWPTWVRVLGWVLPSCMSVCNAGCCGCYGLCGAVPLMFNWHLPGAEADWTLLLCYLPSFAEMFVQILWLLFYWVVLYLNFWGTYSECQSIVKFRSLRLFFGNRWLAIPCVGTENLDFDIVQWIYTLSMFLIGAYFICSFVIIVYFILSVVTLPCHYTGPLFFVLWISHVLLLNLSGSPSSGGKTHWIRETNWGERKFYAVIKERSGEVLLENQLFNFRVLRVTDVEQGRETAEKKEEHFVVGSVTLWSKDS